MKAHHLCMRLAPTLLACVGNGPAPDVFGTGAGGSSATVGNGGSSTAQSSGARAGSGGAAQGASSGANAGSAAGATPNMNASGTGGGTGQLHSGGGTALPGRCAVPTEAQAASTAGAVVVGSGTPASCTSSALVAAVQAGGAITFDCGPEPVVIELEETLKIRNDAAPDIVIDGGGRVTLSGQGQRRILYMNTCDQELVWTTPHCDNQDHPRLTLQNLTFADGNASGQDPDGGGAVFVRGGRLKIVNSTFVRNRCDALGPDVGGAAVRVLDQFQDAPVFVVGSTFGGAPGQGNIGSNGGGLSSIGVSFTVINSYFSHNEAIGEGANPARSGTPGGGSGGAIYADGNTFTLSLCGTDIEHNHAREGGGAIFFVSNDRSGTLRLEQSRLSDNPSDGFETEGYPGIFVLARGEPVVDAETVLGP